MSRLAAVAIAIALAACGESSGPTAQCTPRWYRVDGVELPTRAGDGTRLGRDLDGDGNIDNAFGAVLEAVISANADIGDVTALATARLDRGDPVWRIALEECDDGVARIALSETVPPFEVTAAPGRLTGGRGDNEVPITVLADPLGTDEPIAWTPVIGTAIDLAVTRDALDGTIVFALPMPASQHDLLAPFAAYLTGELRAGTSTCAQACDQNHDGVCTAEELLTAPDTSLGICTGTLVQVLIAPDVTIDGADALSAGVGIHATLEP